MRRWPIGALICAACSLSGCDQTPPSWTHLIGQRVQDQYPNFRVTELPQERLQIERPGLPPQTVEIEPLALHCRRGPRDCDYVIDELLLKLRPPLSPKEPP
jgi:hypothetical protein